MFIYGHLCLFTFIFISEEVPDRPPDRPTDQPPDRQPRDEKPIHTRRRRRRGAAAAAAPSAAAPFALGPIARSLHRRFGHRDTKATHARTHAQVQWVDRVDRRGGGGGVLHANGNNVEHSLARARAELCIYYYWVMCRFLARARIQA